MIRHADPAGARLKHISSLSAKANRILLSPVAWYLILTLGRTLITWRKSLPNNFVIFRTAAINLLEGRDLYVSYAALHFDLFKYSPTFAFLFLPFAALPPLPSLLLYNVLSALAFTTALKVSTPDRRGYVLAAALLLWPFWFQLNGAQTNPIVLAAMVGTIAFLERNRAGAGGFIMMASVSVKVFPVAVAPMSLMYRNRLRFAITSVSTGIVFLALPLLVTSPAKLLDQYLSWRRIENVDYVDRGSSVMGLLHGWFGMTVSNHVVQIIGMMVLILPLFVRRKMWNDILFRRRLLASTLIFVVLFNHQAEYDSYIIAATGLVLWWTWSGARLFTGIVIAPAMAALHPFPYLLAWLLLQVQLLGFGSKVSQNDIALSEARAHGD